MLLLLNSADLLMLSNAILMLLLDSTFKSKVLNIFYKTLINFYIPESEDLVKVLLFFIKLFSLSILLR